MSIVGADPAGGMSMSVCAVMDMAVLIAKICCVATGSAALVDVLSVAALHKGAPHSHNRSTDVATDLRLSEAASIVLSRPPRSGARNLVHVECTSGQQQLGVFGAHQFGSQ